MKKSVNIFFILIISFGLLLGCSASKEEAISQSRKIAETTFMGDIQKPTKTTKGFSYYLPEGFEITDEMENNVILSEGKQEYILFVNPQETPDSQVIFNELKNAKKEESVDTFKSDGRFGYIIIMPAKDKKYEVIVGIGGIKMTTLSSAGDMVENTKNMMEITNSVQYSDKKEQEK